MDSFLILIFCLVLLTQLVNTLTTTTTSDYQKLVYNQCQSQTSSNVNQSGLLPVLFQQFIAQSEHSKFFKTIVGDEDTAVTGKFQCRNDLSPEECKNCVSKFANVSREVCGETLPARIHLSGCYAHYEKDWAYTEPEPEGEPGLDQILHRKCSRRRVRKEFEETMNAALSELAVGVMTGEGFYEMTYDSVYVMAQCEGNLGMCDCAECVSNAVQLVEEECRYSVSGEIYLTGCFISYKYWGIEGLGGYSYDDDRLGSRSPKLVAIVIGGLVALFVGFGLCYCLKSCGKKKDDW